MTSIYSIQRSYCSACCVRLTEETKQSKTKDKEAEALQLLLTEKKAEKQKLGEVIEKEKQFQDYLESSASDLNLPNSRHFEASDVLKYYEHLQKVCENKRQRLAQVEEEISTHKELLETMTSTSTPQGAIAADRNDHQVNDDIAYILERTTSRCNNDALNEHSNILENIDTIAQYIKTYSETINEWEKGK